MSLTDSGRSISNIIKRSEMARESGRWPKWQWPNRKPAVSWGWLADVSRQAENGIFAVLIRDIEIPSIGKVSHAAITTATDATDITWAERQRIKNELFGRERVAVEVMPPESELVDGANMYHIWMMPPGYVMPFTLATRKGAKP